MGFHAYDSDRQERIRRARLRQPRAELERKAAKATERANLYSQEEIDLADAEASELADWFTQAERVRNRPHGQVHRATHRRT